MPKPCLVEAMLWEQKLSPAADDKIVDRTPNWWCGDKNRVRAQPWVMNWKPGARWAAHTPSLVSQHPSAPQSELSLKLWNNK